MGADLVGIGFTHDRRITCAEEALLAVVSAIRDEVLTDEVLGFIDPAGAYDGEDLPAIREALAEGAVEYLSAICQHRMAVGYDIPGTELTFVFAGGATWGDDPFDGFAALCLFVRAAEVFADLGDRAGLVCGGLPDPATILDSTDSKSVVE